MKNKYTGKCFYCGGKVSANTGTCWKAGARFAVAHLNCAKSESPSVINCYSPVTGNSWSVNSNGRCEDAPCCGCCA